MHGIKTIIAKELADQFSSYRFIILFALIAMVSLVTVYMVGFGIRAELSGIAKPKSLFLMLFTSSGAIFSLVQFVAFFGPLVGLILGFDAINRERNEGTLSKLLSQPIYRDVVINGKFLAGLITIAIMMTAIVVLIAGLGLRILGIVPGIQEVLRIVVYLVISILYIAFWLETAILFSILFRSVATSALAALAVWIFFSFFVSIGAGVAARALAPDEAQTSTEAVLRQARLVRDISLVSPMTLYTSATAAILDPKLKTTRSVVAMGPRERLSLSRFSGPLSFQQSILVVMPYIISLVAITAICFSIAYIVFMRQEIRSL